MQFDPATDPRVQEALSRKYSNDVVMLLPLREGAIAVFNSGRELCGIAETINGLYVHEVIDGLWHPPTTIEPTPTPKATLDDLELL